MSTDRENSSIDYGNSSLDIRHRVAVTAVYQLPFGKSASGFAKEALKGWQVNSLGFCQTGLPFTVQSQAVNPATGLSYVNLPNLSEERPDQIGSGNLPNPSPTKGWFNVDDFVPQTLGTFGDKRVNQLRAPHD